MAVNIPPPLVELLNKSEPGFILFCHAWPMRVIRVSASVDFLTFRVEQLILTNKDRANPKGTWHTKSTHGGQVPGEALKVAMEHFLRAQNSLRAKITRQVQQVQKAVKS